MKIVATHASVYGASRTYAEAFAKAMNADCLELTYETPKHWAQNYDIIVHFGSLYHNGMRGKNFLFKQVNFLEKKVIIATVGLYDPHSLDFQAIIDMNIPMPQRHQCKIFHLIGEIDTNKLSITHRMLIILMSGLEKRSKEKSADYRFTHQLVNGEYHGISLESLEPMKEYVNKLVVQELFK